jgi:hypothetical protein
MKKKNMIQNVSIPYTIAVTCSVLDSRKYSQGNSMTLCIVDSEESIFCYEYLREFESKIEKFAVVL